MTISLPRCIFELAKIKSWQRTNSLSQDASLLFKLTQSTFRLLNSRLELFFSSKELSASAWGLLFLIHSLPNKSISPSGASDLLFQSRPQMTRAIEELISLEYIQRNSVENDRRRVTICITQAGELRVNELLPELDDFYLKLTDGLSTETIGILSDHLLLWIEQLFCRTKCSK